MLQSSLGRMNFHFFSETIEIETLSTYKYIHVLDNFGDYSEVRVSYDAIADMNMGLSKTDSKNNDFELVMGGYAGTRTMIRNKNQGIVLNKFTTYCLRHFVGLRLMTIVQYW